MNVRTGGDERETYGSCPCKKNISKAVKTEGFQMQIQITYCIFYQIIYSCLDASVLYVCWVFWNKMVL